MGSEFLMGFFSEVMAVIAQHCELPNTTQWYALRWLILLCEFHLNAKGINSNNGK